MRQPIGYLIGSHKTFVEATKTHVLRMAKVQAFLLLPVWDHPPEMEMDLTQDEFEGMKVGAQVEAVEFIG